MKLLKVFLKSILIDGSIAALFVLWKGYGIEGAGNILLTFLWILFVITFLTMFVADKTHFKNQEIYSHPAYKAYDITTDVIFFCVLAYYGLIVLAVLKVVTKIGIMAAKDREPKKKLSEEGDA